MTEFSQTFNNGVTSLFTALVTTAFSQTFNNGVTVHDISDDVTAV